MSPVPPTRRPATAISYRDHNGLYARQYGRQRGDKPDLDNVFRAAIGRFPRRVEGEAILTVSHVLDVAESGDWNVWHVDRLRQHLYSKHGVLPLSGTSAHALHDAPTSQPLSNVQLPLSHHATAHGYQTLHERRKA